MESTVAPEKHEYRHLVQGAEPHCLPLGLYWFIFGCLLFFTYITVLLSTYDLGSYSLLVTLLIASTKATLVLAVFMHLWFDNKFFALIVGSSLVFLSLFMFFSILDVGSRDWLDAKKANFLPRDERVYERKLKEPDAPPLMGGLKEVPKDELNYSKAGH